MKLDIKALTCASVIVWGFCFFLVAAANLLWPPYGAAFLELMRSLYPGYKVTANLGNVIVGTLYAVVDGAIGGAVFAWVYNAFAA